MVGVMYIDSARNQDWMGQRKMGCKKTGELDVSWIGPGLW